MKSPRLFVDQPLQIEQSIELDQEASKYITRVLRRSTGDALIVFNGDGYDYEATLTATGKTSLAQINAQHANRNESPLDLTLVQSLAKGTKLDLVIQKATELGVNRIIPVSSDRSVLQIDSTRLNKRMDHWRAVAISACTQCQRSVLPVIDQPGHLKDWLGSTSHNNTFMLHPTATKSISSISIDSQSCTIIVGPEGGFNAEETDIARSLDIIPIACGPRILRTETAGFTAMAILQSRFGDLN